MQSEHVKAVKKEELREDYKCLISRKLKEEDKDDDDYKPIMSSLSNPVKEEIHDKKPVNCYAPVSQGLRDEYKLAILGFASDAEEAFRDEPAKLKEFRNILRDYKYLRADVPSTLAKLVELMKDYGDLLRAFCVLFPRASTTIPSEIKPQIAPDDLKRRRDGQSDGANLLNNRKKRSEPLSASSSLAYTTIDSSKQRVSTRQSRFLHLLDRTEVETATFVGSRDMILPRISSGKWLIESLTPKPIH